MLTNQTEQNVLQGSYKGDENPKEVLRSQQSRTGVSSAPQTLMCILVTGKALLTLRFWPSRLGRGHFSKLPGEADGTGASQWSALWVVMCHFLPQARNQRVFSKSMAGTFPSSQDSWCGWQQPRWSSPLSGLWGSTARELTRLLPLKVKSVGQPALPCSPHNTGKGLCKKWATPSGAACQIPRLLLFNPNGSSGSEEETQQHGRHTNSVPGREILEYSHKTRKKKKKVHKKQTNDKEGQ